MDEAREESRTETVAMMSRLVAAERKLSAPVPIPDDADCQTISLLTMRAGAAMALDSMAEALAK